jgi:hypothetical protein
MYSLTKIIKYNSNLDIKQGLDFKLVAVRSMHMSWKSILGSDLNLSLLELALALAGSSVLMLSAVLLFFAYNFFEKEMDR